MAWKWDKRRWTLLILGAVVVVLIGLALRPTAVPADFEQVERGPLEVTVSEEGETRVRERYAISAPVAGKVLRIELEPGDEVRADETVLATFQPGNPALLDARTRAEARARVKAAEAALEQTRAERGRREAELEFFRSELERYRRLRAEEIVSHERFESAELDERTRSKALSAAKAAVETAREELAAARATLIEASETGEAGEPMSIRSPVDGVVLRRLRESESVVPAGEPILEVGDPAELEIISDLLSTDAVRVKAGQRVLIEEWGGETALEGRVERVEPSGFTKISALGVEEQRVNVIVDFEDPREAWEALGDGYRVEIRIVVWEDEDVLKVPVSALFRREGEWAVFAVEAGQVAVRRLEIGQRNALEAEVLGGLEAGARVIAHPSDEVEEGVAVEQRSS